MPPTLKRKKAFGRTNPVADAVWKWTAGAHPQDWITDAQRRRTGGAGGRSQTLQVRPEHGESTDWGTTDFHWFLPNATLADKSLNWTVTVRTYPGASVVATLTPPTGYPHAVIPPGSALAPGEYEWRPTAAGQTDALWRRFTVRAGATSVAWPTRDDCYAAILGKALPRYFPADLTHYGASGTRAANRARLITKYTAALSDAPLSIIDANTLGKGVTEADYMAALAIMYLVDGTAGYLNEAKRRVFGDGTTTGLLHWNRKPGATLSGNGTTATASQTAHGLVNGQKAWIAESAIAGYHGHFTVTVVDANTFQYPCTATGAATAVVRNTGKGYSLYQYDDTFRFAKMALGIFADVFLASCTAGQITEFLTEAGFRLNWTRSGEAPWGRMFDATGAVATPYGYELEDVVFTGHQHNAVITDQHLAAPLIGRVEGLAPTDHFGLLPAVQELVKAIPVVLQTWYPSISHDGGSGEGSGYLHAMGDFWLAAIGLGYSIGVDMTRHPSSVNVAKFGLQRGAYSVVHGGEGNDGDDGALRPTTQSLLAGLRVGGLIETKMLIHIGQHTPGTIDAYAWWSDAYLSPATEPSVINWKWRRGQANSHMAAVSSDVLNPNRTLMHMPARPWLHFLHSYPAFGDRNVSSNGQMVLGPARVYDVAFNSGGDRYPRAERTWGHYGSGTISWDAGRASTRYPGGTNFYAAQTSRIIQHGSSLSGRAYTVVRDLLGMSDRAASQYEFSGTGVGYVLICPTDAAVEQGITITASSATSFSVTGSVTGAMGTITLGAGTSSSGSLNHAQAYIEVWALGTAHAASDKYTSTLWRTSKNIAAEVAVGDGVVMWFNHITAPTSRTWELNIPTADVRQSPTIVGNGTTATVTWAGHGKTPGIPIPAEVINCTPAGLNGAVVMTVVDANTLTYPCVTAGTAVGTVDALSPLYTQPPSINFGPQVAPAGPLIVTARNNAAMPMATARITPTMDGAMPLTQRWGWKYGDASLSSGVMNGSQTPLLPTGGIPYRNPVLHRDRTSFQLSTGVELLGWVAGVDVGDAPSATFGRNVVTGTTPNRIAALSVDAGGTYYVGEYSEVDADVSAYEHRPSWRYRPGDVLPTGMTMTRSSAATHQYADGTVDWSPENSVNSVYLDSASWSLASVTLVNVESPVPGAPVYELTTDAGNTARRAGSSLGTAGLAQIHCTGTVWVRKGSATPAAAVRLTTNDTATWNTGASTKVTLTDEWQRMSVTWKTVSGGLYFMIGAIDVAGASDATCYGKIQVCAPRIQRGLKSDPAHDALLLTSLNTVKYSAPRIDYSHGLDATPAQNLLIYAEELDNAAWAGGGLATPMPVATNVEAGPLTGTTYDIATASVGNSQRRQQLTNLVIGQEYTFSCWIKRPAGGGAATNWRLTWRPGSAWTGSSVQIPLTDAGVRVSITFVATETMAYVVLGAADATGTPDATCYGQAAAACAALVAGPRAGDYVKTVAAQVTNGRVASVLPGLLCEPQATNFIKYSQDFNQTAQWNIFAGLTVTNNFAAGPSGAVNASRLTFTGPLDFPRINMVSGGGIDSAPSTQVCASIFCKINTTSKITLFIRDGDAGTTVVIATLDMATRIITFASGANGNVTAGFTELANGWFRFWAGGVRSATGTYCTLWIVPAAAYLGAQPSADILIFGAQGEPRAVPTSYIPTLANATAIRTADQMKQVTAQVPNFSVTAGTWMVRFAAREINTGVRIMGSTASPLMSLTLAGAATRSTAYINSGSANSPDGRDYRTGPRKIALGYDASAYSYAYDGVAPTAVATGMNSSVPEVHLGHEAGGSVLNGWIFGADYFPTRISNQRLQALSA